jgi:hypothetical protein
MPDREPEEAPEDNVAETSQVASLALQDVGRYQEQLFRLIIHNDDRALRVLSLYGTLIGAIVTAGFALRQAQVLGPYVFVFLTAVGVTLLIGCYFAYLAAWTADLYLPGRKPEFWIWALQYTQNVDEAVKAYLTQAGPMIIRNEQISNRAVRRLGLSYVCGLAALPIGGAASLFAYLSRMLIT